MRQGEQGVLHSFVADFSPGGRKIGNNKMISTALPKAKTALWNFYSSR
jgi:hypothetical protein